ncbi:hypothetical protein [Romboutsia timonensis]|uniref:hypothetical protein n=1 Tax=Romboutsia timonensis TaxID=1776391 RepID=UPI002A82F577|nr:hypothetical protein [Romboutsia timonensis]MDY3959368.1 hypothetical protein [Romboutsia timonensis]
MKTNWSAVLTHNQDGEYGHIQHKQLNEILKNNCKISNLYTSITNEELKNENNKLSLEQKKMKIELIKKHYESQKGIIDRFSKYIEYECVEADRGFSCRI